MEGSEGGGYKLEKSNLLGNKHAMRVTQRQQPSDKVLPRGMGMTDEPFHETLEGSNTGFP